MHETMHPQREIILYQLSLSLLIELPIALVGMNNPNITAVVTMF